MKGLEKLSYPRLAKILAQDGSVPSEVLAEALRESNDVGTPLTEILVRDGLMSEWDLARTISQEFSLPVILPTSYTIDKEVLSLVPAEIVRRTKVLPVDRFGGILSVAMSLLAPYAVLEEIAAAAKLEIFPFVAPASEVGRLIEERVPKPQPPLPGRGDEDWEKLFDEADRQTRRGTPS